LIPEETHRVFWMKADHFGNPRNSDLLAEVLCNGKNDFFRMTAELGVRSR